MVPGPCGCNGFVFRFSAVVVLAGAITSSPDASFELHVVPPAESDAEISHQIDSFAQATDADLAAGLAALQANQREVLTASQKIVQMLVGAL